MRNLLTSLVLLFALATGGLVRTPVFAGDAAGGMSAMECCKKAKHCDAKDISATELCCAVNRNSPAPSSPGASFNFSPSSIIISDSIFKQIAWLLKTNKPAPKISFCFEREVLTENFQPKYIEHHSFLI